MLVLPLYKLYLLASDEQRAREAYRCAALFLEGDERFAVCALRCWIFFFFCPSFSEKLGTKGKGRVTLISILPLTPPAGIQHSGTSATLLIGNGAAHIHGSHE